MTHVRAILLSMLVPALALAESVNVSLTNKVTKGKGTPALHVEILEPIANYEVKLSRDGGAPQVWKGGGKPGQKRTVPLPHPDGVARWVGTLTVTQPDGQVGELPLDFETEIAGPLVLKVPDDGLDLDARTLRFTANQPVARAHLTVLVDSGATLFDDDIHFEHAPAGTPLQVGWPASQARVLTLTLRAYAPSGVYNGVELSPWRFDVAHDDVNFEPGRFDIPAGETEKLDRAVAAMVQVVNRVSAHVSVKLYVLGHTDTVGSEASNRALSLNRAKAIGAYFRRKGLSLPVFYEGFGEEALLVGTADETPEAKNRRAEYILSVNEPAMKKAPFPARWRKL